MRRTIVLVFLPTMMLLISTAIILFFAFVGGIKKESDLQIYFDLIDRDGNGHVFKDELSFKGLEAEMSYSYKLGFVESDHVTLRRLVSNECWSFRTQSSLDRGEKEVAYVDGDMGTIMPLGFELMKSIVDDNEKNSDRATFVVRVGDLAYAGTGGQLKVQTLWDLFINQISPISSRIPSMTATGNHDKDFNYTSYKERFFMSAKTNPTETSISLRKQVPFNGSSFPLSAIKQRGHSSGNS